MLSWSATERDQEVDLRGLIDPGIDSGIDGGAELAAVGLAAGATAPSGGPVRRVADVLSPHAAFKAASVAGAFEILNRIVDATGLPVGRRQVESLEWIVVALGLAGFPHAGHDGETVLA